MRVLSGTDVLPDDVRVTVATVGTFDGVHLGHLDVLARLVSRAAETRTVSLVVTFDPHPLELVNPAIAPLLLTTREEKLSLLREAGVDVTAVLPFTRGLADLSAEQFVDQVLLDRLRMQSLLIGHDHGFGRGREGDVAVLRAMGETRRFGVEVVPPVLTATGVPVSSTTIRTAIASGDLAGAGSGLGRRYSLRGTVVAGEARGRVLGYPTLNVVPDSPRKLLPADGVYAVAVSTARGGYTGMMNVGGRPTFGDDRRQLEAHLFDAEGDFYDQEVDVVIVDRLRDVQRFDGAAALRTQLSIDEAAARSALTVIGGAANLKGFMHFPPSTA